MQLKARTGQPEEQSVRAKDGAADLHGCVLSLRSGWPVLALAPNSQRQLTHSDNQPAATINPQRQLTHSDNQPTATINPQRQLTHSDNQPAATINPAPSILLIHQKEEILSNKKRINESVR
jgi:hypothetical protein